jgi:Ca2+-transporting ATPase
VLQGLLDAAATLAAFVIGLMLFPLQLPVAQTMAFATLVGAELLRAYSARSLRYSVFQIGLFSNRWMVVATGFSFVLLLLVIYLPALQPAFNTFPLSVREWAIVIPLALLPFIGSELAKLIVRIRGHSLAK